MSIRVGEVEGPQADPGMIESETRIRYIRAYDVQPDEEFLRFLVGQVMEQEIPDRAFQGDVFEAIDRVIFSNPPPGSAAAEAPLIRLGDLFDIATVRDNATEIYAQMYGVPASNENLDRILRRSMDLEIPETSGKGDLIAILEDIILQLPPIDETGYGLPVATKAEAQENLAQMEQDDQAEAEGMDVASEQAVDQAVTAQPQMQMGLEATEQEPMDEEGVIPIERTGTTFAAAQKKPTEGGIPTWVWIAGGAAAIFLAVRASDRRS